MQSACVCVFVKYAGCVRCLFACGCMLMCVFLLWFRAIAICVLCEVSMCMLVGNVMFMYVLSCAMMYMCLCLCTVRRSEMHVGVMCVCANKFVLRVNYVSICLCALYEVHLSLRVAAQWLSC